MDLWKILFFILTEYGNDRERPVIAKFHLANSHSYNADVCDQVSLENLMLHQKARVTLAMFPRAVIFPNYISYKSDKFIRRYILSITSKSNFIHHTYSLLFYYWEVYQWVNYCHSFELGFLNLFSPLKKCNGFERG